MTSCIFWLMAEKPYLFLAGIYQKQVVSPPCTASDSLIAFFR